MITLAIDTSTQQGSVAHRGERVQIGDEVERLARVLQIYVLPDRAEIIAPMEAARRLNARQDAQLGGSGWRRG